MFTDSAPARRFVDGDPVMDGKSSAELAASSSSSAQPLPCDRQEDLAPRFHIRDAVQKGAKLRAIPQFEEFEVRGRDGLPKQIPRYQYRALSQPNHIRVFRIYPSENDTRLGSKRNRPSALTGHILHREVGSAATYRALSYCRGSIEWVDCIPLVIDSAFGLHISRSLHDALRAVVENNASETYVDIWADQIAIDQHNLTERGQQVSLMGSIFRHASEVIVWLGLSDSDSVRLFKFVDRLKGCDCAELSRTTVRTDDRQALKKILIQAGISQTDAEVGMVALEATLQRPWFWRLWTFQEVVLATNCTFWCGKDKCSLRDLYGTSHVLRIIYEGVAEASKLDKIDVHRARQGTGGSYLDELLLDLNDEEYRCSEQHDRIYALLALQRRQGSRGHCNISVGYEKSISMVMEEATRAVMSSTHRLHMLNHNPHPKSPETPSWIPDWNGAPLAPRFKVKSFAASGSLCFHGDICTAGILQTQGRIAATVVEIASHEYSAENADAWSWIEVGPANRVEFAALFTSALLRDIIPQTLSSLTRPDELTGQVRSLNEVTSILLRTFFCQYFSETSMLLTTPSYGHSSETSMNHTA